jgi:hypothetical protein
MYYELIILSETRTICSSNYHLYYRFYSTDINCLGEEVGGAVHSKQEKEHKEQEMNERNNIE